MAAATAAATAAAVEPEPVVSLPLSLTATFLVRAFLAEPTLPVRLELLNPKC